MHGDRLGRQLSGCVLVGAAVAGVGAAAAGARPGLAASPAAWRVQLATDPTGAVGLAASTLLWLLIGLIALGVVTAVFGRLPGALGRLCDAVSRRLLPAALRRTVHLMIGVTVGVSALAPTGAWAAAGGSPAGAARPVAAQVVAPGGTLPSPFPPLGEPAGPVRMASATPSPPPQLATATPATPTGHPGMGTDPAFATPAPSTVVAKAPPSMPPTAAQPVPPGAVGGAAGRDLVVVPGDSLWTLAARELAAQDGRDAGGAVSDASIAAEWPRWWAANRAAIGGNPDLIVPGERLRPPA